MALDDGTRPVILDFLCVSLLRLATHLLVRAVDVAKICAFMMNERCYDIKDYKCISHSNLMCNVLSVVIVAVSLFLLLMFSSFFFSLSLSLALVVLGNIVRFGGCIRTFSVLVTNILQLNISEMGFSNVKSISHMNITTTTTTHKHKNERSIRCILDRK